MNSCLAFVLGGGGARGALQVGALRALIAAGFRPDLLVGTSIGAVNAAGLALWGVDLAGVEALERAFCEVADANLMDPRLARLTLRALSGRPNHHATRRVAEFFIAKGISPELRFDHLTNVRLALIGTDLDEGQPVIYGQDPGQSVLEGLLASIALPPWFAPVERNGHVILDGGTISNLPIEPALTMGATEIIALNLDDPRTTLGSDQPLDRYLTKLVFALNCRHTSLETRLAEIQGVAVRCLQLRGREPMPIWDFHRYRELIQTGYEIASREVSAWSKPSRAAAGRPALVAAG